MGRGAERAAEARRVPGGWRAAWSGEAALGLAPVNQERRGHPAVPGSAPGDLRRRLFPLAARQKVSGMPVRWGGPHSPQPPARPRTPLPPPPTFAFSTEPGRQPAVARSAAAFVPRSIGDKAAAPPAAPAPLPAAGPPQAAPRRGEGPGPAVLSVTGVWSDTGPLSASKLIFRCASHLNAS